MREGERLVPPALAENGRFIGEALIGRQSPTGKKGDPVKRNLIRHNPHRLANLIMKTVQSASR